MKKWIFAAIFFCLAQGVFCSDIERVGSQSYVGGAASSMDASPAISAISKGAKSLHLVGINSAITSVTLEDVWDGGGTYTYDESSSVSLFISSSAEADKGLSFLVRGLNRDFEIQEQTFTLDADDGRTSVAIGSSTEKLTNGGFTSLGTEKITDGAFAASTYWDEGTSWTITGGQAIWSRLGGNSKAITQDVVLTPGKYYKATFTVAALTSSSVGAQLTIGDDFEGTVRHTAATFSEYFEATESTQTLSVIGTATVTTHTLTIDNVSLTALTWDNEAGWTQGSGKAVYLATNGEASIGQAISVVKGKEYETLFTIDSISDGATAQMESNAGFTGTARTVAGTFKEYFTAAFTGTATFTVTGDSDVTTDTFTVDNFSVKEKNSSDWRRVLSVSNADDSIATGTVYVYAVDAVTAGVPQTATAIRAEVLNTEQQTQAAFYTIPSGQTGLIVNWGGTSEATCKYYLMVREYGGVWKVKDRITAAHGEAGSCAIRVPEKSDIRIAAISTGSTAEVVGKIDLILLDN